MGRLVFVFCPIILIERTYARESSAGSVACRILLRCFISRLRSLPFSVAGSGARAGGPGGVDAVPSSALAWYRKLSRWRMSRFDTLFGFGASSLDFLAMYASRIEG